MKSITVFKGDGIGPEITAAVLQILKAAHAPYEYEEFEVGEKEYKKTVRLFRKPRFVLLKKPSYY